MRTGHGLQKVLAMLVVCFCLIRINQGGVPNCSMPKHSIAWNDNLTATVIDVEWSYGKVQCTSVHTCYRESWLPNGKLDPQLHPVELQEGMHIRFHPSKAAGIDFPILPVKVDRRHFSDCSTNDSISVFGQETTEDFILDNSFLEVGNNYFIVDLPNHGLIRCIFGLRLNVTIKADNCGLEDDSRCSGNGHCLTRKMEANYSCHCCHGYMGSVCELMDYCADKPCLNNGTCQLDSTSGTGYKCTCAQGFIGETCDTAYTTLCVFDPCENNSTCSGNLDEYSCSCLPGFSGHHCEVNVNECSSSPCGPGMCVDEIDGFHCYCVPGFGGSQCEIQYDECQSSPCQNGGFCIDKLDQFQCDCPMGYRGDTCQEKVSLCVENPCRNYSHTKCQDRGSMFNCVCKPGYTGTHCEVNINECDSVPCYNDGTCKDDVNGYVCLCDGTYFGTNCERHDGIPMSATPVRKQAEKYAERAHSIHVHNLYIVGGTLGGALFIALIVLVGCYCRTHRSYEKLSRRAGYDRQRDDDFRTSTHDVSSVCKPRPSIDSIWEATTLNYHSSQLNAPLVRSLKPKRI